MKIKITNEIIYKVIIAVAVFWLADFVMHFTGVGETNYYYALKFVNSFLLAFIWFAVFDDGHIKTHKRAIYSFIGGTWISFTYLISSYSGLVQFFGIYALSTPPPFVIFGIFLHPFFWWIYHSLVFWLGLEIARKVIKK
jgi:hypothetical protein